MAKPPKGHGARLFDKVAKERGISKSRIYKIIALQRLCDEVKKLGDEGKIRESTLIEISKIDTPARQKLLADLVLEKNLGVEQTRELAKLIRAAESSPPDKASDLWDQFFELKDAIDSKGMTESLSKQVKQIAKSVEVPAKVSEGGETTGESGFDPELRKALGFPELVECVSGRGLDVGTTNIVSAGRPLDGSVHFILQRNAFIDVRNDSFTKRMLIKLGIDHVMHENRMYVIGDPAFELANIFEKETRRPMKDGLISPLENDSLQMISMVIHQVLGNPREQGELVYFCVPADPIDADRNVIYHRGALETVLRRQGFTPKSIIEGHSVVMSELESEDFTGIGVSCGGGMFNVCIAYKSVPALTFSTSRGGDWVDINVGRALGIPASQATAMKESGVDLTHPRNRQEEAICIYYRELIHYTLTTMQRQLETVRDLPAFSHPVELVCAGGTSLVKGFIQVLQEEYEKILFPIEVKRIRLARDPLRSVASGCLAAAQEEMAVRTGVKKEIEAPSLHGNSRLASVKGEVVSKPKEAKLPRRPESENQGLVLPPPKKLPGGADPSPGGFRPVSQQVVSMPVVPAKPKKTDAGPAEQIVSLPKMKDPPERQRGPQGHVVQLPKMKEIPEARPQGPREQVVHLPEVPRAGASVPVSGSPGQIVRMSAVPEAAPDEPAPVEVQEQVLPPVQGIDAGEAPAEAPMAEEVVRLPEEGLEVQPVPESSPEAAPVEESPVEGGAVEGFSEEAVTEMVPAVSEEVPADAGQTENVNLDYPADAIEQALAAAAAMGITGEPIIEPEPVIERLPVEEEAASPAPAEAAPEGAADGASGQDATEEAPSGEAAVEGVPAEGSPGAEGGVELAPFIQQGAEEGVPAEGEAAPELSPEEQQQLSGEGTDWMAADDASGTPEEGEGLDLPPEMPLEIPGDDDPPPLPPVPPKKK